MSWNEIADFHLSVEIPAPRFREQLAFGRMAIPMDGQRIASRRRVLKAGSIKFGGGAFECTIRNISDAGAALQVTTPLYIPDRFTLVLENEQQKRACRVIWRRQKRIGVTFD